jgi:hypothetical protein
MKRINPDKIIVIDTTPEWIINCAQEQFNFFRFLPFQYGDPARKDEGWLFGCSLFENPGMGWFRDTPNISVTLNEYFTKHIIPSVDKNSKITELVRVRANGMNSSNFAGLHTDSSKTNCWAVLYYVNDSSGTTDIYDLDDTLSLSVEPKAGRIVIFPASYPHKANPPTDNKQWRVTLNYNYIIAGEMNNNLVL